MTAGARGRSSGVMPNDEGREVRLLAASIIPKE